MKRKVKRYDEGGETFAVDTPDITEESDSERRSKELLRLQGEAVKGKPREISDYMANKTATKTGGYTSPVKESSAEDEAEEVRLQMMQRRAAERRARERRKAAAEKKESPKASQMFPTRSIEDITKDTKTASTPKRGFGPKITFGTPAQLEKAKKAYYSGFKSGGSVSSASKRADGIATKGKTRGRIC
jgi:hypothetical protein